MRDSNSDFNFTSLMRNTLTVCAYNTFVFDDERCKSLKHGERIELNGDVARI